MHYEYPEHIMKSEQEKQKGYTILHWYQYMLLYKSETITEGDEARQKYLQMGQGHQVIERTLRNTGNIISMECPRRGRSRKGIKPQYFVCSLQLNELVLKKVI